MNLEQAIHAHWADCPALESLLSAERLTTGRTCGGTPPYATLEPRSVRLRFPTNEGPAAIDTVLRIHVWHTGYDEARAIAEQIRAAFDGASLELAGCDQPVLLGHVVDTICQHPDGIWQWTAEFVARVHLSP